MFSSTNGSLYLNSDAISVSTGIFANFSIAYLPTSPAWYAVPHATIYTLVIFSKSSFVSLISSNLTNSIADLIRKSISYFESNFTKNYDFNKFNKIEDKIVIYDNEELFLKNILIVNKVCYFSLFFQGLKGSQPPSCAVRHGERGFPSYFLE